MKIYSSTGKNENFNKRFLTFLSNFALFVLGAELLQKCIPESQALKKKALHAKIILQFPTTFSNIAAAPSNTNVKKYLFI